MGVCKLSEFVGVGGGPIYVMCPIGYRTGGPEALHQLVHSLRNLGLTASITPYDVGPMGKPVHEYSIYDCPITEQLPETGRIHLVLPELRLQEDLGALEPVLANPELKLWIWWLSVDNSQDPRALEFAQQAASQGRYSLRIWPRSWNRLRNYWSARASRKALAANAARLDGMVDKGAGFLAQSAYAADFCRQYFKQSAYLVSDYLGPQVGSTSGSRVANRIAFNAAKAGDLILDLEQQMPGIDFVGIGGMTPEEVAFTLSSSSAYVELGPLPGRDRLPREAARLGTPVLLLRRGAGSYSEDFPLPPEYCADFDESWIADMRLLIERVIDSGAQVQVDQSEFRDWVLADRPRFDSEVRHWALAALTGHQR